MSDANTCPECGFGMIAHLNGCHPPSRQNMRDEIAQLRASLTATQAKVGEVEKERDQWKHGAETLREQWHSMSGHLRTAMDMADEHKAERDRVLARAEESERNAAILRSDLNQAQGLCDKTLDLLEKTKAERDQALARAERAEGEVARARHSLGGFGDPKGPFGGDVANGINAISIRCASAERALAEAEGLLREAAGAMRKANQCVLAETGTGVIDMRIIDRIDAALGRGAGEKSITRERES